MNTTPHRAHFFRLPHTHTHVLTCVGSRTATVQDVRVSLRSRRHIFLTHFLTHLQTFLPPSYSPLTEITTAKDDTRQGAEFGRLAKQLPFTGKSPTISLKWAIRRFCRYSSRGERAKLRLTIQARTPFATTIDSEVDDAAPIVGMLASPLYIQEREASAGSQTHSRDATKSCTTL